MKYTKIFVFSALAALSAVVLRFIQITTLTDAKTGFFLEGMEDLGATLSLLTVGIIAVSSALVFVFKKEKLDGIPTPSAGLSTTAILAGLAHLLEPFISRADLTAVPSALAGLRLVMLLGTGAIFCWFGICIFKNKSFSSQLFIIPVLTWVVRLMTTFISYTGMSNISENLYDILMLITTLVFMLLLGKTLYGISKSRNCQSLIAVGIAAVLCTAASALPSTIVSLIGTVELAHKPIDSPVTGIFTAAFITAYLLNICKRDVGE